MPRTIVGVFDTAHDAQAAQQALEQAGFQPNTVQTVSQYSSGLDNNLVRAGVAQSDAQLYSQEVQHGSALVVAQAVSDQEAERAASIVDRYNAVNISRRAANRQPVSLDRLST